MSDHIETLCVQGGYRPGNGEPRQIPIVQSTTFKYESSDEGYAVGVGRVGKFLNVQYRQGRVGNRFAKNRLGIGTESGLQFLRGTVWRDESKFYPHPLHGYREQIVSAAINRAAGYHMVTTGLHTPNASARRALSLPRPRPSSCGISAP